MQPINITEYIKLLSESGLISSPPLGGNRNPLLSRSSLDKMLSYEGAKSRPPLAVQAGGELLERSLLSLQRTTVHGESSASLFRRLEEEDKASLYLRVIMRLGRIGF